MLRLKLRLLYFVLTFFFIQNLGQFPVGNELFVEWHSQDIFQILLLRFHLLTRFDLFQVLLNLMQFFLALVFIVVVP